MYETILVIAEQQQQRLTQQSIETVVAAQQLPKKQLIVALAGKSIDSAVDQLRQLDIDSVWPLDNSILGDYNADVYISAFSQIITQTQADLVVLPHSYQSRDFAPALAAWFKRSIISDVSDICLSGDEPIFMRHVFQGRLRADVVLQGNAPRFVSVQAGCFKADEAKTNPQPCEVKMAELKFEHTELRVHSEQAFRANTDVIDLNAANIIVAIGRGIKSPDNIPLFQTLATLLNAELAASRPICDEGWLPAERQIGSSGQTVAPSIYIAIGISGAIQHIIGMKSATTIVAINNDPNAPIFDIADYAIVADLFDVVPALISALEAQKQT